MKATTGQPIEDMPRERLVRLGCQALADRELLALVVGAGVPGRSAVDLADTILGATGGLRGLAHLGIAGLGRLPGIGPAKASQVIAAIELGRRSLAQAAQPGTPLHSVELLADFLIPRFGSHPRERFGVVLLDTRHRLIRAQTVSEGALDRSIAVPRDVLRDAVLVGAAAVVLFHNHPSGDPMPTKADVLLTRRFIHAGDIVGVDVVDHLILTDGTYASLRRSGLL
jgi:DNA repair protein RadC